MGSCIRRDTYHIARGSVEFPKADNPANVTVVTEKARYERQDSALTSWTFVLTQIKASLSRPSDEGRQQAWCGLMMVTCLCASRSDIRYYACAPTPKRKNCNHLIQTYPYDSMSAMSRQRVRGRSCLHALLYNKTGDTSIHESAGDRSLTPEFTHP